MTTKNKEMQKSKMVAIIEKIIRWAFYVELTLAGLVLLTHLTGGWSIVGFLVIPPLPIFISALSLIIATRIHQIGNIARVAIVLNWVVIVLVFIYIGQRGQI
jgi:hypothetical protein